MTNAKATRRQELHPPWRQPKSIDDLLAARTPMFNRHKLATKKFPSLIKQADIYDAGASDGHDAYTDIPQEDLELLLDPETFIQPTLQADSHPHLAPPSSPSEKSTEQLRSSETTSVEQPVAVHGSHQLHQQLGSFSEIVKQRIDFDECAFRAKVAELHTAAQTHIKKEVDALYDAIDEMVNSVSQQLYTMQLKTSSEVEEKIVEIRRNVHEGDRIGREVDNFVAAVQEAYKQAFSSS